MTTAQVFALAKDVLSSVAIVIAGLWTYFLYVRRRVGAWNLVVSIAPTSTPYDEATSLLMCKVTLRNSGSVRIIPGANGCQVTVRQVPRGLPRGSVVDWNEQFPVVLKTHDVLRVYLNYFRAGHDPSKDDYEGVYSIEPGGEYHEQVGVIAERGFVYLVEVTFWWRRNEDSMTEYAHVLIA
jgi:hypothetical protein